MGGVMAKFKVIKTFIYSEEITLEAESKEAAIHAAMHSDECDRIHDDHLYDCTASEVREKDK